MKTLETIVMLATMTILSRIPTDASNDFMRAAFPSRQSGTEWSMPSRGAFERVRGSTETWEDAAYRANAPEGICEAVRSRVQYEHHVNRQDARRDVAQTWLLGFGDCEDFALLIKAMCDNRGFKATIYVFACKQAHQAHAVVVGEQYGSMWMSSNGSFENVLSLEDVRTKVIQEFGWFAGEVTQWVKDAGPAG